MASLSNPCPWKALLDISHFLFHCNILVSFWRWQHWHCLSDLHQTNARLMSHILLPWILWECCDFFFSHFGTELCRWVAICRTAPSYLRKQLHFNVSTPSLKWIIPPASFRGEHGKPLNVLNWFVSVRGIQSFLWRERGAFLQILNRTICFGLCPALFPSALTPAMLCCALQMFPGLSLAQRMD